jgi:hypothetical protein
MKVSNTKTATTKQYKKNSNKNKTKKHTQILCIHITVVACMRPNTSRILLLRHKSRKKDEATTHKQIIHHDRHYNDANQNQRGRGSDT